MTYKINYRGFAVECETKKEVDELISSTKTATPKEDVEEAARESFMKMMKKTHHSGEKRHYKVKQKHVWYTEAQKKKIAEMVNTGEKLKNIAKEINRRPGSVYYKIKEMGLMERFQKVQGLKKVLPSLEITDKIK